MPSLLSPDQVDQIVGMLDSGPAPLGPKSRPIGSDRQPVHTVSGGAHLFKADTVRKMGQVALQSLEEHAGDFIEFAHAFRLPGSGSLARSGDVKTALLRAAERNVDSLKTGHSGAWLAATVYKRVINKLRLQPVEDYRIDFEDGFGTRSDLEEDQEAERTGVEVASGHHDGALSPFIGIRIKPLTPAHADRALRTLDLFVSSVVRATGRELPDNFAVTLPKVSSATEVRALVKALELIEESAGLPERSIAIELMIETPVAVVDSQGSPAISRLVHAAEGRCRALHFDAHDYTAGLGIAAPHQTISHPACDYARGVMLASMAHSEVWLSDGATNIVPVAPHRPGQDGRLASDRQAQNKEAVHRAWRLAYEDASYSLRSGFYQGWDIHPAQLPARYTAVYSFFLRALDLSSHRLKALVEKAGRASLVGDIFDDAATGQGLLNFFRRAIGCGAITIDEASRTGLSMDELKTSSFSDILGAREFEEDASP